MADTLSDYHMTTIAANLNLVGDGATRIISFEPYTDYDTTDFQVGAASFKSPVLATSNRLQLQRVNIDTTLNGKHAAYMECWAKIHTALGNAPNIGDGTSTMGFGFLIKTGSNYVGLMIVLYRTGTDAWKLAVHQYANSNLATLSSNLSTGGGRVLSGISITGLTDAEMADEWVKLRLEYYHSNVPSDQSYVKLEVYDDASNLIGETVESGYATTVDAFAACDGHMPFWVSPVGTITNPTFIDDIAWGY